jgi:hypothetical protein
VKQLDNLEQNQLSFKTYGVKIGIRSGQRDFLQKISRRLAQILPNGYEIVGKEGIEHFLDLQLKDEGGFVILKNGEIVSNCLEEENLLNYFESQIRLTVAEFAVGKVFLHAGVVGWKGKAVVIPASSFAGKTTLVAELIRKGAVYYSDEYAVLDREGLVYPFPKMLSMRGVIDEYKQKDCAPERFGAVIGTEPLPIGLILISRFTKENENQEKRFDPEILSPGQGFLEILAHTIPIRINPKFSLEVLKNISTRAIIAKTKRGEAKEFASLLIKYLDAAFQA